VIGKKALPEPKQHQRFFGTIADVSENLKDLHDRLDYVEYDTKTRGKRHEAPARPCGEGVYAIVDHHNATFLTYVLELPNELGEVQAAFHIKHEASYVITVKNPTKPSPFGMSSQKPNLPNHLMEILGDYRFKPANPVEFLDYAHVEFILIGVDKKLVEEFGDVGKEIEDLEIKDLKTLPAEEKLYKELHMSKKEHPPGAL